MSGSDRILISSIDCLASIGVTAAERGHRQRLSIDVEFAADAATAAKTDSIDDAVDYARVAAAVADICGEREFHLIETLAEAIASRILGSFPVSPVRILIRKISPIATPRVAYVSVEITRP